MKLSEVAERIGARLLTHSDRAPSISIERVYAADKMSDLMGEATDSTLLVSSLSNPHLLRIAELLDVPGICLLGGTEVDDAVLQAALDAGKVLMVMSDGLDELTGRLQGERIACVRGGRG